MSFKVLTRPSELVSSDLGSCPLDFIKSLLSLPFSLLDVIDPKSNTATKFSALSRFITDRSFPVESSGQLPVETLEMTSSIEGGTTGWTVGGSGKS